MCASATGGTADDCCSKRESARSNVRARTGASIVAIGYDRAVISNPGPSEILAPGARVAVLGSRTDIASAARLLGGSNGPSEEFAVPA